MGGKPKSMIDPNLAKQQQDQLDAANAASKQAAQDRLAASDALRRKQLGFASLITTPGGELGAPRSLLGGGTAAAA